MRRIEIGPLRYLSDSGRNLRWKLLTSAGGVSRRLHVAREAFAPKRDQVVPHHRDLEHRLDVALAQLPPGHFPEFSPIIAADPDPPDDAREDLDCASDVGPGELLQRAHRPFAVRIRLLRLRGIARVE